MEKEPLRRNSSFSFHLSKFYCPIYEIKTARVINVSVILVHSANRTATDYVYPCLQYTTAHRGAIYG